MVHADTYFGNGGGDLAGGVFVESFVPISYQVKHFIEDMPGSGLLVLRAPMAAQGDGGTLLVLLNMAFVMPVLKKPLPDIPSGMGS